MAIALFGYCFVAITPAYAQGAPEGQPLEIKYAGGTAEPYTAFVQSGGKYTISQSYSWVRDETSRYNLVSYSIDDGAYNEIPRKARGNFLLDVAAGSAHTVTFKASVQYPVSVVTDSEENLAVAFSPLSPTGDDWFDAGSDVTITVSNREIGTSAASRQQIISWALDNSKRLVEGDVNSSFTTPAIHVASPHQVKFVSKTQHYVDIVTSHGTAVGEGWYDAGSTAAVSVRNGEELLLVHVFAGWEDSSGGYLEENSQTFLVDSPKTLTAKWTTDYSRLLGLAILPIAAAGGLLLFRKRTKGTKRPPAIEPAPAVTKIRHQVMTSEPLLTLQETRIEEHGEIASGSDDNVNYSKEIATYALQKSIEKLEALHSFGLVSDTKFSKIKEKLDQAFD